MTKENAPMNRILCLAIFFLSAFALAPDLSAQTNQDEEDASKQAEYLRRLESIQSDEERMDSLY